MTEWKKNPFYVFFKIIMGITMVGIVSWLAFCAGHYMAKRNHGQVFVEECCAFTESVKKLDNPNRGFYYIYGFVISDTEDADYNELVPQKMSNAYDMSLAMVQINLRNYNNGPISDKGLESIARLFEALQGQKKEYLVRFLYDWDGENMEAEPQKVEWILTHMRQLEPIFKEYKDIIFVHQGIFIGNWGEMNGTKHLPYMQVLTETLHEVLQGETFIAVRMPAQWRKITETANPQKSSWEEEAIAHYLSLFNDGMMGNYGDYGTYGYDDRSVMGDFSHWSREEELAFQEELCKYVPNGGEVIVDNAYNDLENAIANMRTMHITYLNRDYDRNVLDKWAATVVNEPGIYDGMDGLTYMEICMGYRILIRETDLNYLLKKDTLEVSIILQNVGFAPIYKDTVIELVLQCQETQEARTYTVAQDLRSLTGGNESDKLFTLTEELKLTGLEAGKYNLYFKVEDKDSTKPIYFANEQDMEAPGYKLGSISVEPYRNLITKSRISTENPLDIWFQK